MAQSGQSMVGYTVANSRWCKLVAVITHGYICTLALSKYITILHFSIFPFSVIETEQEI